MTWRGARFLQKRAEFPSPAIFPALAAKTRPQPSPVATDDSIVPDQSAPVPWDWAELTPAKPVIDPEQIRRELGYVHGGAARPSDSTSAGRSAVIPLPPSRR